MDQSFAEGGEQQMNSELCLPSMEGSVFDWGR